MNLSTLTAISPVDGRYRSKLLSIAKYFSEYGLIKYRVQIEIEYFIALAQIPLPQLQKLDASALEQLRKIYMDFSESNAEEVKDIEKTTNHDVKAVEYFIKSRFDRLGLSEYKEFIHFGLTSQDINNTAVPLSLKESMTIVKRKYRDVIELISENAREWRDIPMLARTHGQPASPTALGKEFKVFSERLRTQLESLDQIPYCAKFGGATGNFNAHKVSYPDVDWNGFANTFVSDNLGLKRSYPTTQIEHYDHLAALFDNLKRLNVILIDFCRDTWQYISMNYFNQKIKENEVGSSAMPHKVNPIDFENAEGNLGIANAIFEHLSTKLPISRLQRDLTDSTVLRNVGVPIAHTLIALGSILRGIDKLQVNETVIREDLLNHWAVVAEAIQTILRRESYPNPYEELKKLTRTNEKIEEKHIKAFIDQLDVDEKVKKELRRITPQNYVGILPD